jgi:hypothetical protein
MIVRVYSLFKKLHMYAGLLNLSILLIFGVAGLWATFEPAPERRKRPDPDVEFRDFTPPAGLDDKAAADRVHEFLNLPLTTPLPKFAIRRDANNDLALNFYTPNGIRRAVVLEKEHRIRIETQHIGFANYLNGLHTMTLNNRSPDWRVHWWTYYNEFSIWSLIGMSISGVYLWLASRPRYRPARWTFALGSGAFILLYAMTR